MKKTKIAKQKTRRHALLFLSLLLIFGLSALPPQRASSAPSHYQYNIAADDTSAHVHGPREHRQNTHHAHNNKNAEQQRPAEVPRPIPITPYPLSQPQHMTRPNMQRDI